MSQGEIETRIKRNENDVTSIYEILAEHKAILDEHTATLNEHTATLNEHTVLLNEHTARFDRLDETLAEVLRRLPEPPAA